MSGTHVNAFKSDFEDAYKAAVGAVSKLKTEMDKLVEKMESDAAERADSQPGTPTPPAETPVSEPTEAGKNDASGPGAQDAGSTKAK